MTFDPKVAAVDALVTAVNQADGPASPRQHRAEVKEGPPPRHRGEAAPVWRAS